MAEPMSLQERARAAAQKFTTGLRGPVVIEFAGVPKAGKTTTLNAIQSFLKRTGFRVEVVIERASVCPIRDKKHANFNVWTACTTLAQILERTQDPPRPDDPHILILDRGLFDSVCWLSMMERLSRILPDDRNAIERFLLTRDWSRRIKGVLLMTASPDDAMRREKGLLPVDGAGGSIMNPEVLAQMRANALETADRLESHFRIYHLDTSSAELNSPEKTCQRAADTVLSLIEEQLQERVLYLSRSEVDVIFGGATWVSASKASQLVSQFGDLGKFDPRDRVESDASLVQALPVVVVRNASGDVLRLRRRESTPESALHERVVVWAGGHVRSEDKDGGEAIVSGATRELNEELRLAVSASSLKLVGAVFSRGQAKLARHVAIVYEWRAPTNDVAIALNNSEFFERRGNSLSGTFVSVENLSKDVANGKLDEPWSYEIVREFLAPDSAHLEPSFL